MIEIFPNSLHKAQAPIHDVLVFGITHRKTAGLLPCVLCVIMHHWECMCTFRHCVTNTGVNM